MQKNILFEELNESLDCTESKLFKPVLTVTRNRKGVIDVDTVKGCTFGMSKYPDGGCYGECYAYKIAKTYGITFDVSVSRKIMGREHLNTLTRIMNDMNSTWYRIGVLGDPCHDWKNTLTVINALRHTQKTPVIVTKHWQLLSDEQISHLKELSAIVNTSVSGMDTSQEISCRMNEHNRLNANGVKSILRIVTCKYGDTPWGKDCNDKQKYLMSLGKYIDNPLRASRKNARVINGDIKITAKKNSIGGGKIVSLHDSGIYLSDCKFCPDQCGTENNSELSGTKLTLFPQSIQFEYLPIVIGSGYEKDIAKLALEDGIAHRAARKNMQIHSAVVLKINDIFSGFFTFQNNEICKEFCLLQSVIKPEEYTPELYKRLVAEVLKQNNNRYPALITTDPKSKFETPAVFESFGFETYLKMSGFHYMVQGEFAQIRMKILAHITMTNVWNSISAKWLELKKEWNKKIMDTGNKYGIQNPTYATRDGCWQGKNGFANVVTGHSHNGNASVLDPVACEVILRFFMPKSGHRIYNPFGGGVQFGFVAGSYGYEYIASEIRQNQCDANNDLCQELTSAKWIKSDSSIYEPDGMFDLIFTCPPYYKVEKYVDYDGNSPDGEINSFNSYEQFRDALFSGYKKSIACLNSNRFFVVMTGDSRDKNGAYYCSESETEMFLKSCGLSIYNKIVYLECEFTRLAHAKKTLNMRKFPKREQKIIAAFKGDISAIKEEYAPVGRL